MSRCRSQLVAHHLKIVDKYLSLQSLDINNEEPVNMPFSTANPPLTRRISAVFYTVNGQ